MALRNWEENEALRRLWMPASRVSEPQDLECFKNQMPTAPAQGLWTLLDDMVIEEAIFSAVIFKCRLRAFYTVRFLVYLSICSSRHSVNISARVSK